MAEEYKAQGNRPPKLEGEFTPKQQIHYDARLALKELVEFLPPTCRESCMAIRAFELSGLGYKVARGETSILDAARQTHKFSAGCTGPVQRTGVYDGSPSCPPIDKRNRQPACW